ncbi:sugar phosphate isomerase/epimerase [Streptacidiphilus sp. MAP12-16]
MCRQVADTHTLSPVAEPTDEDVTPEDRAEEPAASGRPRRARAAKATGTGGGAGVGAAKRAVAVKKAAVKKAAGTSRKAVAKKAAEKTAARAEKDKQDRKGTQAAPATASARPAVAAPAAPAEPSVPHAPTPAALAGARPHLQLPAGRTAPLLVPDAKVALSTASVYPENTAAAFEIAGRLGYDGVEVMVWTDPVSQDLEALRRLSDYHGVPILAVHAPCLLITQRVWGTDPWSKLVRARAAAEKLGASTVVVHPPFRWQRQYARDFVQGIWQMAGETDVRFAVENMYPWRYRDREVAAYAPDWDPTTEDYRHFTVDLSHVSTSRTDALAMVERMGDRLAHVHLADGSGSAKDEHLIPGRGNQPCAELLERLARTGFAGHVVLEVNTRRAPGPVEREADLAEALAFTRLHLAAAAHVGSGR